MKKVLLTLAILGLIFSAQVNYAQESEDATATDEQVVEENADDATAEEAEATEADSTVADTTAVAEENEAEKEEAATDATEKEEEKGPEGLQLIKKFFIDGGGFMFPVLICLILGLAIAIEKIITLNLKSVNSKKLLKKIETSLKNNDVDGAQEICRNTRGSVASIFYQAFLRRKEGIEGVEKSIVSYGSVQMGLLEKGLIWISLFIALAPMLGFMGTVIGMIEAFDSIQKAGSISPGLVAGGIKIALLTTVGGLIVAVFLQVFYNYLVSKIDSIVNDMEDSTISLVDMFMEYDVTKK
jgi:biopolymer transport protein ExbB